MKLRHLSAALFAVLAFTLTGCSQPDSDESTDVAEQAIVLPLDPTAIVAAINGGGATYDADEECLVVAASLRYLVNDDVAWSLAGSGFKMRPRVFELINGGETFTDPETGAITIHTSNDLYYQLVEQGAYAHLVDP